MTKATPPLRLPSVYRKTHLENQASRCLEFPKPLFPPAGILVLREDNPTDLPDYDEAAEIPVIFEQPVRE